MSHSSSPQLFISSRSDEMEILMAACKCSNLEGTARTAGCSQAQVTDVLRMLRTQDYVTKVLRIK